MSRKGETGNNIDPWNKKVKPYLDLVVIWARNGFTDKQICLQLDIPKSVFNKIFQNEDEFYHALLEGRRDASLAVENALFKRATGYLSTQYEKERVRVYDDDGTWTGEYKMTTVKKIIKEVLPNVDAQKFWLRSRVPERWGDKAVGQSDIIDDNFINALKDTVEDVWGDEDGE